MEVRVERRRAQREAQQRAATVVRRRDRDGAARAHDAAQLGDERSDVGDVRRARIGDPLPLEDGEADAGWAGEVLEHVADVGALAGELRRVVRPGGVVAVTTPDHSRLVLLRLALRPRAADEHFHPYADHLRFFTRRTLGEVLRGAGFRDVRVIPRRGHLFATAR